jgi:hypothetical protein
MIVDMSQRDAEDLVGRLFNWKFVQAQQYLEGQPQVVRDLVNALAMTVGNSGWEDGYLGEIIGAAVAHLIGVKSPPVVPAEPSRHIGALRFRAELCSSGRKK